MKRQRADRGRRRPGLALWLGLALLAAAAAPAPAAELSPRGGLAPSTWFMDQAGFQVSAHGFQGCEGCHPGESRGIQPWALEPHPDPGSPGYLGEPARREFDYRLCARCHQVAHRRYQKGAHAEAMRKQDARPAARAAADGHPAPTCAHCHNPHQTTPRLGRVELGRRQVEVCGSCHLAQKATYLENYHGQMAANLGYAKAAFCTDCHGAHTAVSLKKPEAALAACRRCHPQAPPAFAEMVIHPAPADRPAGEEPGPLRHRKAVIQALAVVMGVLVVVAVVGFYGHGLMWMLRELHEKIRRR